MRKVGVLCLQGDFLEHVACLERMGVEAVPVRLPQDLAGVEAMILPGGESTTIGGLMEEYGLLSPVKGRAEEGMPIWGTCAGMILMAKEVEDSRWPRLRLMDIRARRNAYGRQKDSFEADVEVPALGSPLVHAIFIRAPVIVDVGARVEVLASLPQHGAVAVRQGNLLASAFHPELSRDLRFHAYFLKMTECLSPRG